MSVPLAVFHRGAMSNAIFLPFIFLSVLLFNPACLKILFGVPGASSSFGLRGESGVCLVHASRAGFRS